MKEESLGISQVSFSNFRKAVKALGALQDLSEEHIKTLAETINIDADKLLKEPQSQE
jgi:hypothetical protein